jgi:uncharacterized membrane protein
LAIANALLVRRPSHVSRWVALGTAVFALALRIGKLWPREGFVAATAMSGAAALYAASFALLAVLDFQPAEIAITALWAAVALGLLLAGLGLTSTLFGLALGKIFLYDLANLSSLARAFSFLAVGGVLLVAALLYQRLTEGPSSRGTSPQG